MATLKTTSHKMAEFTISFFPVYIIHSCKNYSLSAYYVRSAFIGIKMITKEAHYVTWLLPLMKVGQGKFVGKGKTHLRTLK